MSNQNALSAQDVADMLAVSKSTVYNMIRSGEISSYKVGRKVRFTEDDVKDYISHKPLNGKSNHPASVGRRAGIPGGGRQC